MLGMSTILRGYCKMMASLIFPDSWIGLRMTWSHQTWQLMACKKSRWVVRRLMSQREIRERVRMFWIVLQTLMRKIINLKRVKKPYSSLVIRIIVKHSSSRKCQTPPQEIFQERSVVVVVVMEILSRKSPKLLWRLLIKSPCYLKTSSNIGTVRWKS